MPDKTAQPSRRSTPLLILLVIVAAAVLIPAIRFFTRETVAVRVSPVTHENLVSQIATNGKVEPVLIFQPHTSAPGVVRHLYVDEGEKVTKGELLIQMDDSEATLRVAEARSALEITKVNANNMSRGGTHEERILSAGDLQHAQDQQRQAAATLQTMQTLESKGAASKAEVISAQQRLSDAQASLKTTQERRDDRYSPDERVRMATQLREAQASMAAAENNYDKVSFRAPFAGTVYSLPVSQYDFVQGGEDLLQLADLTHIHVRAYFDEPEIGKLTKGEAVKIVWDAKPNRSWHGHVEVAPTTVITYGTRNVGECLISVDDADGELLPNTNVTVTVTYSQRFNVLSVPREALHTDGSTNYVFRVVNHRLVRTLVQVGALNLTRVEITGGLSERDVVALSATSNRDLTNGLEVQTAE